MWETKIRNSEVTPHAIWHLAKSLMKRDRPKTPTAIQGPSGLKFLPVEKSQRHFRLPGKSVHTT